MVEAGLELGVVSFAAETLLSHFATEFRCLPSSAAMPRHEISPLRGRDGPILLSPSHKQHMWKCVRGTNVYVAPMRSKQMSLARARSHVPHLW